MFRKFYKKICGLFKFRSKEYKTNGRIVRFGSSNQPPFKFSRVEDKNTWDVSE